jgi:hypothetical protein
LNDGYSPMRPNGATAFPKASAKRRLSKLGFEKARSPDGTVGGLFVFDAKL